METKDKDEYLRLAQIYYQALRIAAIICLKISSPDIALDEDDYEAMDELRYFVEQIDPKAIRLPEDDPL